jgi:succinate dehydrogenase/fumarate reductase cytochrome b subunit
MRRLHYWSGLCLAVFIGLHLFNHLNSLGGIEAHIAMMEKLRLVYRNPLIEVLLLLAVLTQIVSGIRLFRQQRKSSKSFFDKIHLWSGLYLAFFLIIHLSAVAAGRWILKVDTNFYYGAAGLNVFPLLLFFAPYYALAILAFWGHVASIHVKKIHRTIGPLEPEHQGKLILGFGFVLMLAIMYGLTNGFQGFEF